jgi:hypothetical protein
MSAHEDHGYQGSWLAAALTRAPALPIGPPTEAVEGQLDVVGLEALIDPEIDR